MQRRKMLAALGSVAVGGATAVSTGAFTSVSADRSVEVNVAGDNSAFLTLDATVSSYTAATDGTVEFRFNKDAGAGGSGLNDNADTFVNDVLRVANKGTQAIKLQVGDASQAIGQLPNGPLVVSYTNGSNAGNGAIGTTPFASSPAPSYWNTSSDVNEQDLGVGQDLYIHFGFYLKDSETLPDSDGSSPNTEVSDIPDQLNFYAGSTSTSGSDFPNEED